MNLEAVSAFLELVKSPDKYIKLIEDLKAQHKAINDSIELTGKAQEIPKLHTQAKLVVEKAHEEAVKIKQEAIAKAAEIVKNATELSTKVEKDHAESSALAQEARETNKKAKELQKQNEVLNKTLLEQTALVSLQQNQLLATQTEFSEKLAKLQAAVL